jgi:hypothetical protein
MSIDSGDYKGLWGNAWWEFNVFLADWLGDVARLALIWLGMYFFLYMAILGRAFGMDSEFVQTFVRLDEWANYGLAAVGFLSFLLRFMQATVRLDTDAKTTQ